MKYYAVTDDPRELYHYGVKGMKWGQHLFGEDLKPKSAGYKNAAKKLKSISSAKKNTVQRTYNARAAQDKKYQEAVKRSQDRLKAVEMLNKQDKKSAEEKHLRKVQKMQDKMDTLNALNKYDKITAEEKQQMRQARLQRKADKYMIRKENADMKNQYKKIKNAAKSEAKYDKLLQQAREGRLRYGKLSEEQIQKVQERLALENRARMVDGAEKPKFGRRLRTAIGEGILQGISKGVSGGMEEFARAKVQTSVLTRGTAKKKAKLEGQIQRTKNREANKKTHRDIKRELDQDLYREQIMSGTGAVKRVRSGITAAQKGKALAAVQRQNKLNSDYQEYLDSHALSDKEARKQYLDSISGTSEASSYGKVKRINKASTKAQQQRMLLNANRKQKEKEAKEQQLRDKVYERYLLPSKNDDPEKIIARYENEDFRDRLYGNSKSSSNNPNKPKPAPKPKKPKNPTPNMHDIFADANNIPKTRPQQLYDQVREVTMNRPKTAIEKSIERHKKKRAKKHPAFVEID